MDKDFWIENGELRYKGEKPLTLADAFDISINKWKIISDNPEIGTGGTTTCGLCMLFCISPRPCLKCPIFLETKNQDGCVNFVEYSEFTINSTSINAQAIVKRLEEWKKKYVKHEHDWKCIDVFAGWRIKYNNFSIHTEWECSTCKELRAMVIHPDSLPKPKDESKEE